MNWSIDISPIIPGPLFWGVIFVAAVLIGLLLLRRTRGAALRALSLAALIGALANPTLRQEERESLANTNASEEQHWYQRGQVWRPKCVQSV